MKIKQSAWGLPWKERETSQELTTELGVNNTKGPPMHKPQEEPSRQLLQSPKVRTSLILTMKREVQCARIYWIGGNGMKETGSRQPRVDFRRQWEATQTLLQGQWNTFTSGHNRIVWFRPAPHWEQVWMLLEILKPNNWGHQNTKTDSRWGQISKREGKPIPQSPPFTLKEFAGSYSREWYRTEGSSWDTAALLHWERGWSWRLPRK